MDLMEAKSLILSMARPCDSEDVPLFESLGRVLHAPVAAAGDVPAEPRSRLDGYALRSISTAGARPDSPAWLDVVGETISAGHRSTEIVPQNSCLRIMTGAPMPPDCDAVVAQEEASVDGNRLALRRSLRPGNGVASEGMDARAGEEILSAGEVLTPVRVAVLEALGISSVAVSRKPAVALLATGDEVKEVGGLLDGPFTYCNGRDLLGWLAVRQGAHSVSMGIAPDEPLETARMLGSANADLVISTGGIGHGDRDFILKAWERIGVRTLYRQLNISPGRSSAMGIRGETVFLAFPGNPWASRLLFEELAAPMLRACQGARPEAPAWRVTLGRRLRKNPGEFKAVRGSLDRGASLPTFIPAETRGLRELAGSFAYTILDSHVVEVAAGTEVLVKSHDLPLSVFPLLAGTGRDH